MAVSNSSKTVNLRDLESQGMTSVYVDGIFVWQVPRALLLQRVPTVSLKNPSDDDLLSTDAPSFWEITGCSREAFRLFNEWLYSPNGRLKAASPTMAIKCYFDAIKFASDYCIHEFLHGLVSLVIDALQNPQSGWLSEDLQSAMGSGSCGGAIISSNLAVLLQHGMLEAETFKTLVRTPEMARDVLVWLELFRQCDVENLDQSSKLKWAFDNLPKWAEIVE